MKNVLIVVFAILPFTGVTQDPAIPAAELAKTVFKQMNFRHSVYPYDGEVLRDGSTFYYNARALTVYSTGEEFLSIFSRGLLHPEIIIGSCPDSLIGSRHSNSPFRCDSAAIYSVSLIPGYEDSIKKKKFELVYGRPGMHYSAVCHFELVNENAFEEMSLGEFILRARLTFFKPSHILAPHKIMSRPFLLMSLKASQN